MSTGHIITLGTKIFSLLTMLKLIRKTDKPTGAPTRATLPWEKRIRSRLRITLHDGTEAGILLPRGTILRDGDYLLSEEGICVQVKAAPERLSSLAIDDPLLLAKICYHLGNRHVALEIKKGKVSYLHDHVLDKMVEGLGGTILLEDAPFEPEHGAYSDPSHGHSHG